jgi:addiction module HigA family antidote
MSKQPTSSFKPDYAVAPGETLRETLQAIGMSQSELAERTGRPKKTINEIIAGKAAITAETALQLERVLGPPASFWNNLERNYRETLARLAEEKQLQEGLSWLNAFPVRAMIKFGWLPKKKTPIQQLQALLSYFGVAGVDEWESLWTSRQAAFRRSPAFQANPQAIAAWMRRGEMAAAQVTCRPYDAATFRETVKKARSLTPTPPETFEPALKRDCAKAGVAVVFVPELPGTHIFGSTRWLNPVKALIQLSLRGKSDDLLWFTFFHEAAHILLHGKRGIFIEGKGLGCGQSKTDTDAEKAANQFARDLLIPRREYDAFVERAQFDHSSISSFAHRIGIAPGIVVGRLQHDHFLPYSHGNQLKSRFTFAEESGSEESR